MNPSQAMPNVYNLGYQFGLLFAKLTDPNNNLLETVSRFPVLYKEWWLNLVRNDPIHVLVETTLLIAILYFLSSRSKENWKMLERDKLTPKEEHELLVDWKKNIRAPLAPPPSSNSYYNNRVVVHKMNGRVMTIEIEGEDDISEDTVDLEEEVVSNHLNGSANNHVTNGNHTTPNTHPGNRNNRRPPRLHEVLNFCTTDFLGRSGDDIDIDPVAAALAAPPADTEDPHSTRNPVKQAALQALDKYGCGSCGPRGFYGTVDVHLELEKKFAQYLGTDNAILYSDGASACSSTIAAFCKRGDLLVVDEGIYEPLMTGVTLSRANVKWFAHNDMEDLRRVMEMQHLADKRLRRKINEQRRFIVVEGLYKNTGNICPLDQVVALKEEFCYRLILDESNSFGVLGPTGRGVTELYGKRLMRDVEITTISLENAVGSIGGITTGSEEVVDHQRLSGSGYCYSASSPPFTATAAILSLELMSSKPEMLTQLQSNLQYFLQRLEVLCKTLEDILVITSDHRSPLVMIQVATIPETENLDKVAFLTEVVRECLHRGVATVAQPHSVGHVKMEPPAAIRFSVLAVHSIADLDQAVRVLGEAIDVVLTRIQQEAESQ